MFQFQPGYSLADFVKRFPVTSFLMLLWTALYVYTAARFGLDYDERLNLAIGIVPDKVGEGQYWRLVTYAYLHNGIVHFLTNLIFLFFFAPPIEQRLGPVSFLGFHLYSVIASGLAIYFFSSATAVGGQALNTLCWVFTYTRPSFSKVLPIENFGQPPSSSPEWASL